MKIAVEEGYMRGVVVDKNNNDYVYYKDDENTGKNLFLCITDNKWYEETKRDNNGDVCELQLRGDL